MSESEDYLKLMKDMSDLQLDETEFQIITALRWYGSLNLKKISKMIQRPESTTLRYIRKMRDKSTIEFDSETSERSWGNFYKLSKRVSKLYEAYMKLMDDRVERITFDLQEFDKMSDEELDRYVVNEIVNPGKLAEIPSTRAYFNFVSNLQKMMVNETMDGVEQIAEMAEKEGFDEVKEKIILPPLDVSTYVSTLKICKFRHVLRINELIFEFDRKLQALGKQLLKEMDTAGVPEEDRSTQFVNVFTGSLDLEVKFKE